MARATVTRENTMWGKVSAGMLMPATGTPSPGGLFWHQALLLIERCLQGRSMVGMDVVELAPLPGLHHADFTAAKLTHALMGFAQRAGLPRKA